MDETVGLLRIFDCMELTAENCQKWHVAVGPVRQAEPRFKPPLLKMECEALK
jgi:hypothetical protein